MPCVHRVKELQNLLGIVEAQPKENTMRPKRLTQFLMLAGSLALTIAQGIVLLFMLLIMAWLHGEPRSKLVSLRLGGRMKEKDRWEGFAASTRYAAIPLRASLSKTRVR